MMYVIYPFPNLSYMLVNERGASRQTLLHLVFKGVAVIQVTLPIGPQYTSDSANRRRVKCFIIHFQLKIHIVTIDQIMLIVSRRFNGLIDQ